MFYFGVDYYPEHWPKERWPEDARLMASAGVNLVRLAEFAWSFLEPSPNRFDFEKSLGCIRDNHGVEPRVVAATQSFPSALI